MGAASRRDIDSTAGTEGVRIPRKSSRWGILFWFERAEAKTRRPREAVFKSSFELTNHVESDVLILRLSVGRAQRLIRFALICLLPWAATAPFILPHDFYPFLIGIPCYLAAWWYWELFDLRVRVEDQTLHLSALPAIRGWFLQRRVSLHGVTEVRAHRLFGALSLRRFAGRDYVFVPQSMVRTRTGARANECVAEFITERLRGDSARGEHE